MKKCLFAGCYQFTLFVKYFSFEELIDGSEPDLTEKWCFVGCSFKIQKEIKNRLGRSLESELLTWLIRERELIMHQHDVYQRPFYIYRGDFRFPNDFK